MTATHEDIMDRLNRGDERFKRIEKQQQAILEALGETNKSLKGVGEDVAATKEIVEAWSAVKTMGRFVKWTGGLVIIASGALAVIKLGVSQMVGWVR